MKPAPQRDKRFRSKRAVAVAVAAMGFVAVLVLWSRLHPTYQSRALVAPPHLTGDGSDSLEHELAVARGTTVRLAATGIDPSLATTHIGVVDGVSLEFRARSRDRGAASSVANAYARAYVDVRGRQLLDAAGAEAEAPAPGAERLRRLPHEPVAPSVSAWAPVPRSPEPPWPSERWMAAGMALVALALAVPARDDESAR
jgi:hypothetical protein